MNTFYLGIEVVKAKLDCALFMRDGRFKSKKVSNTPEGFTELKRWLHQQGAASIRVCMEATSIYWDAVAEDRADAGFPVSVVNSAQIEAFGTSRAVRTKTDTVDAKLIAHFCRALQPAPWTAPSHTERHLRARVLRLAAIPAMHTQETNRLPVARDTVRDGIKAHVAWLDQEIKQVTNAIRELLNNAPDLNGKRELLDSIPGLGERTIATLLAFLADPARFDNARRVAAFAGLNPCQRQSGSSVNGTPRLSKIGHAFLRKALYMPAMVALYKTHRSQHYRQRLLARGKPPMVIIGAMMRKLLQVAYGVLKSGQSFNPALRAG